MAHEEDMEVVGYQASRLGDQQLDVEVHAQRVGPRLAVLPDRPVDCPAHQPGCLVSREKRLAGVVPPAGPAQMAGAITGESVSSRSPRAIRWFRYPTILDAVNLPGLAQKSAEKSSSAQLTDLATLMCMSVRYVKPAVLCISNMPLDVNMLALYPKRMSRVRQVSSGDGTGGDGATPMHGSVPASAYLPCNSSRLEPTTAAITAFAIPTYPVQGGDAG